MAKRDKRDYPIFLLREISEFQKLIHRPYYFKVNEENDWIEVYDCRTDKFFFKVLPSKADHPSQRYRLSYKPATASNPTATEVSRSFDDLKTSYERWKGVCELYESVLDPFIAEDDRRVEEEIYNDIKILDEDADSATFETKQQHFISVCIERIKENIRNVETEVISEEHKKSLVEEFDLLIEDLDKEPKNKIMLKLSRIAAKAKKYSMKAGNFIMKEITKELLKEAAKRAINMDMHAVGLWLQAFGENVSGFLH